MNELKTCDDCYELYEKVGTIYQRRNGTWKCGYCKRIFELKNRKKNQGGLLWRLKNRIARSAEEK